MTQDGELSELEEATIARSFDDMAKAAFALAKSKGWHDADLEPRNLGEMIALVHSELSEMLEAWRDGDPVGGASYHTSAAGKPAGIVSEAADVVIRILAMAAYYKWDLGRAVIEKHAYNATRTHRHGGKKA